MVKTLTVFTPTYNRAYTIGRLYESLKMQTSNDFCWLIVDDGSNDNTKDIVNNWIKEGILDIYFCYQENAGKMAAHNKGIDICDTSLFVCVDSDDYLVPCAVEHLINQWQHYAEEDIAGIIAKKGFSTQQQLGDGVFPQKKICKMSDFMGKQFTGDTTLCFKTDILKKYKFPIIEGEKFISESFVYDQIDCDYRYIIDDEILTICEYLEDGYSRNMDVISYHNPVGRMYHEAQNMDFNSSILSKFSAAIRYNIYKFISNYRDVRSFSSFERMLLLLSKPIGYILYKKKKKRVKKHETKIG